MIFIISSLNHHSPVMTTLEELQQEMDDLFEQAESEMSSNEFLERSNQLRDKYNKLKNSLENNYYNEIYIPFSERILIILAYPVVYIENSYNVIQ